MEGGAGGSTKQKDFENALSVLLSGGIVGVPTETVYGLAGLVDREEAIRQIFTVKERPYFDPLIVHIGEMPQWEMVAREIPTIARTIATAFWPGPVTIILPKRRDLNPMITSGLDRLGVRMPAHDIARELARRAGRPYAAPSANKFGKTSPTTAEHVRSEFSASGLLVLDGGPCVVGIESTVIDVVNSNEVVILRPGAVSRADLKRVVGERVSVEYGASPVSPGQGVEHYQPAIPLVIRAEWDPVEEGDVELLLADDPLLAARSLYGEMRRLSASGATRIVVRRKAEHTGDSWRAIWNRLERAEFKGG